MVDSRYETIRILGTGGMASVWLARDTWLERDVALKRLLPAIGEQPGMAERFTREGLAAAALSHPNIVTVFDTGVDADGPFLVMEYVAGTTLSRQLAEQAALDSLATAEIGAAVAEALAHAHQRGVVHRDVKPANILINQAGEVKLTDFGIALLSWETSDLTQTATQLGTAAYFSPEQAAGHPAGPASDVYSLGVMLYRMVSGEVPFNGDNPIVIAGRHLNDVPTPPSSRATVHPRLEAIILACLAKDPDARPQAAELAEWLEELGDRTAVMPVPAPVPATTGRGVVAAPKADGPAPDVATVVLNESTGTPMPHRLGWVLRGTAFALVVVLGLLLVGMLSRTGLAGQGDATPAGALPVALVEETDPPATAPTSSSAATEASTTTVAPTTTTLTPTTTVPPAALLPATLDEAIALLEDQVDEIAAQRSTQGKVRKELRDRTFDLVDDWEEDHKVKELRKDVERLSNEIDEALEKDRIDPDDAATLSVTLDLILDLAGASDSDD